MAWEQHASGYDAGPYIVQYWSIKYTDHYSTTRSTTEARTILCTSSTSSIHYKYNRSTWTPQITKVVGLNEKRLITSYSFTKIDDNSQSESVLN